MWCDWSKRTADSRQARCSSRQFVYSDGTTGIHVGPDLRIPQQIDRDS